MSASMKHLTRAEVEIERLLRATRSVAVLGARARPDDPSVAVVEYLKAQGFDVFPVRPDGADVAGLTSWEKLGDVPGSLDLVLVLSGGVDEATITDAAAKSARALWLAPGVPVGEAQIQAAAHGLLLVHDRDIVVEHRHTEQSAGRPRKLGVNVGARRRAVKETGKRDDATGYVAGGGGGSTGGGGGRAVLDEKKMVVGKPRRKRMYRAK